MHELGHLLLKHQPVAWDEENAKWEKRSPRQEKEATYLGGCLQILRRGLLWASQQGMSIAQVGAHFSASVEMVRFRINVTRLRRGFGLT